MKAKLFIGMIIIVMLLVAVGYFISKDNSRNNRPARISYRSPVVTIDTLMYPLDYLYSIFSNLTDDPFIGNEARVLVEAYSGIINEMKYLDSISGMRIDFVGVSHNDYDNDFMGVKKSQDSLRILLEKNNWQCIGYESSDKFGFLNKQDLINSVREEFKTVGMDTSISLINYALNMNRRGDVLQQKIENGSKNIIGTERVEVWRLQQKIAFIFQAQQRGLLDFKPNDPDYGNLLDKSRLALNQVRSSVAIVRTAKIMRKYNLRNGAIVYGSNHLDDFAWLHKKFGIESKFYSL